MQLICFLALFLHISTNLAALVNVTIDDEFGDSATGQKIVYLPSSAWNFGPKCERCKANVDASQAMNGIFDFPFCIPRPYLCAQVPGMMEHL